MQAGRRVAAVGTTVTVSSSEASMQVSRGPIVLPTAVNCGVLTQGNHTGTARRPSLRAPVTQGG